MLKCVCGRVLPMRWTKEAACPCGRLFDEIPPPVLPIPSLTITFPPWVTRAPNEVGDE